jgi:large subunit ribosomal protein L15
LPYRRGFKNVFRVRYTAVNVGQLDGLFDANAEITPDDLVAAGLLRHPSEPYKVLGEGELEKPLTVSAPRFSGAAREAIEKAGGTCVGLEDNYRRPGMGRRRRR